MGMDFTSFKYPMSTEFSDKNGEEDHDEPASEMIRSLVQDAEHPVFSSEGLKKNINKNIGFSNSGEDLIEGDIDEKVLKEAMQAAFRTKFPPEILLFVMDMKEKLDKRSSGSDANGIISEITQYVSDLNSSLGRQPKNFELMAAYMMGSADKVKKIIDDAEQKPFEESKPSGSKYDDLIFYKDKGGEKKIRTNKQVKQYFMKRMPLGSDTFRYMPIG